MNNLSLARFTDLLGDEIDNSQESQPLSLSVEDSQDTDHVLNTPKTDAATRNHETYSISRPARGTGQYGHFRSVDEIDVKYRSVFSYPFFNLVQSSVIEDALYSDKSMVVCAPTGSGKTVVFEMAIVQLLMEIEDKHNTEEFKIIYMAPVKALCTERLTEWYPKFTRLGLLCIEVTGDTDVDFSQLKPYRIIITTPEKWDMVTRRWREHRQLVEVIKLFLIDEVHILNDETRGPVLEAVVSRMKTIESSAQSAHRIEQLQKQYQGTGATSKESPPRIRFVAVSATVSNPEDVAAWLGNSDKPAVYYKFGDESRPVKLKRVVEGYRCPEGTSIFKFDIILNYKLWPVIQKYHNGKPTLIFCNTRKSVALTAETLSRELTVAFSPEQKAKLTAVASTIKNKKLQGLVLSGVGCHHAGLLFEERTNIERAFRNRDLPILITTTTLAMGVNLPAHLVIIKNTQQYVNGAYQEYSISTILQMVGRAGRPQFDTEATAVIMTRLCDKARYQSLVGGSEPLQSYLHKRLAENLNSEAALGTVNDVAQCVQWLRSTFLYVRAARDPKRYLGLTQAAPQHLISKKIEELCVKAMNGLATSGLITMDEASCIESTEAGRLMSIFYLDLETMKHIMKINGTETLDRLLWIVCECHELADMHLRVDERRVLNALNRNNAAATIRFPMKGKINTRQMKLNCIIQAILGCLPISDPSLNQEAMKVLRIAVRVCKCLVTYVTRPVLIHLQPKYYSTVLNSLILAKCIEAQLWENSSFVSKQLKGIGPTFSTLLATAGKVNFMLLEESHPRDLERIMNKGPPAGNVLRKQISLLPKYQITVTPVDEKSVTVELALLNKNCLAENMDNLTAGDGHKSHIVVGDSENNLLLLISFKDKELINVYDGTITHKITRKLNSEHKLFAHCVSSTFVGIDARYEYLFKDLEPVNRPPNMSTNEDITGKSANKQTTITDTFKKRKRKNTSEIDIVHSKEKKKRDSALIEKFKNLKNSFGRTSRELKEGLDKSVVMSYKILQEYAQLDTPTRCTEIAPKQLYEDSRIEQTTYIYFDKESMQETSDVIESEDCIIDEKVENVLKEIENEISKDNATSGQPLVDISGTRDTLNVKRSLYKDTCSNLHQKCNNSAIDKYDTLSDNNIKKRTQKKIKSNYNFIDLLEKNINLSDEEEQSKQNENKGFSDTIKSQVEKYLQKTRNNSEVPNRSITELLEVESHQQKVVTQSMDCIGTTEQEIYEDVPNNQMKCNETPTPLQNKTDVNINIVTQEETNETASIIKDDQPIIEKETDGEHFNKTIMDRNAKTNKDVEVELELSLDQTGNYSVDKPLSTQRFLFSGSTSSYNTTHENQNKFKTSDLILRSNNSDNILVPVINKNLYLETSNTRLSNTTIEPNTTEYQYRSVPALPPALPSCKKPETQELIVFNENNATNSKSDINIQLSCSRGSIDESKQFLTSSEACYNSNNNATNQNNNMTINKYFYSTTKIDVASKNAPDHVVRVIRRVKLDLDVTEIISRKDKENGKILEIETDTETEKHVKNCHTNFKLTKPFTSCTGNKEMTRDSIPHERRLVNNVDINSDMQETVVAKINKNIFLTPKSIRMSPLLNVQRKQIQHKTCNPDKKVIDKKGNAVDEKDNAVDEKDNEQTSKFMETPQQGDNLFTNILQKYSESLSKTTKTGNLTQSLSQPKSLDNGFSKAVSEKAKKPFKMANINNLNTSLHTPLLNEILKQENKPEIENVMPCIKMEQKKNNSSHHSENNERINYRDFEKTDENIYEPLDQKENDKYYEINKKENLYTTQSNVLWENFHKPGKIQYEDIDNDIDLTACQLLAVAENEHEQRQSEDSKVEFNIDQSMLNPKTLLQCLSKDEHENIVPPPPEFCDENECIPSSKDDNTNPTDYYEPLCWNSFYEKAHTNFKNESIFHNDSCVESTPSNELETWTLSQNYENYENLAESTRFNLTQPFTILRNSAQHRSLCQNVAMTNQSRHIVPPPPEFCDENELVNLANEQVQEQKDDNTISTDYYEPLCWNSFYEQSLTNLKNESIFEDDSRVELTPSKELETWTLSQNDENNKNLVESTSSSLIQPFTIMRNSGQHRSPFQNVSATRQNRLGQYKFCTKSKLVFKK